MNDQRTIRCDLKQVYYLLGNLALDQLPVEVALPVFYNTIVKYLNTYRISPNNYFLKHTRRAVSDVEVALNIDDYGSLVQVQALVIDPVEGSKYVPIPHVAFEQLRNFERSGILACTIFHQDGDNRLRFSLQQKRHLPTQIQVWYEPTIPIDDKYHSENPIPECFKPLVEYETASILAPMVRNVDANEKSGLLLMANNFKEQAIDFRRQFETIVNSTPEKQPFKRRRPRLRERYSRMPR